MNTHSLTAVQRIKLAAGAWSRGVPLGVVIGHAWGAGFDYEQTLLECSAAGYSMCIAGPRIMRDWARMDAEYLAYEASQKVVEELTPEERAFMCCEFAVKHNMDPVFVHQVLASAGCDKSLGWVEQNMQGIREAASHGE